VPESEEAANATLRVLIAILILYGLGIGYNLYGTPPTPAKSISVFSSPLLALHVILILSSLSLACLLGAWASGSEFTQKGQTGFSMSMAMLAGVALLCAAINIRMLSAPASSSAPANSAPANN